MTRLRSHLQIARSQYHAARYPGDLAEETASLTAKTLQDTARLRDELQTARDQYQAAQFPGDLAEVLPSPEPVSRSLHLWRSIARAGLVAAALALVIFGHLMLSAGEDRSSASTMWNQDLGGLSHFPWHSGGMSRPSGDEMMAAAPTSRPLQLPDWLKPVEQPLADSGRFIVNVGKDLAHQADALVHMM